MEDLELKKKIMSEIMGLMDEKEGEQLKSHPKLAMAKVEIEKPGMEEEVPSLDDVAKDSMEPKDEEIDPEMMAKLLEMYKGMK